jgi:hypothetical protein
MLRELKELLRTHGHLIGPLLTNPAPAAKASADQSGTPGPGGDPAGPPPPAPAAGRRTVCSADTPACGRSGLGRRPARPDSAGRRRREAARAARPGPRAEL